MYFLDTRTFLAVSIQATFDSASSMTVLPSRSEAPNLLGSRDPQSLAGVLLAGISVRSQPVFKVTPGLISVAGLTFICNAYAFRNL